MSLAGKKNTEVFPGILEKELCKGGEKERN